MEIFSHPWTQGDTASAEEIQEEFAKRENMVKTQA
jgi:hypothetical protein